MDEFALWIHLKDVYWKEEGRSSFDAVVIAAVIGGLLVLGVAPFDLPDSSSSVSTVAIAVVIDILLAAGAILKGKPLLGIVGIFVPPASLVGVVRLASPNSPWARRLYDPQGPKMARAEARWTKVRARRQRVQELVAGAPGHPLASDSAAASSDGAPAESLPHE